MSLAVRAFPRLLTFQPVGGSPITSCVSTKYGGLCIRSRDGYISFQIASRNIVFAVCLDPSSGEFSMLYVGGSQPQRASIEFQLRGCCDLKNRLAFDHHPNIMIGRSWDVPISSDVPSDHEEIEGADDHQPLYVRLLERLSPTDPQGLHNGMRNMGCLLLIRGFCGG